MTDTGSGDAGKAARQQRAAQFQADLEAKDRRRRTTIVGGVVALVVVVAGAVWIGVRGNASSGASPTASATPTSSAASSGSSGPATGAQILPAPVEPGGSTTERPATKVAAPAGISGLLAWSTQGYPGDGADHPGALQHDHVPGAVVYSELPPVGGPHAAIWANVGVYTAPIPTERGVHTLEHGAVWITYDPKLPADQVAALTAFVAKQSLIPEAASQTTQPGQANRYVLMSPWVASPMPAPIVISSWGYQLQVSTPDDPRLQEFVDTFRDSKTYTPEFGSPVDGVPVLTGGRPDSNGGVLPNPDGAAQ